MALDPRLGAMLPPHRSSQHFMPGPTSGAGGSPLSPVAGLEPLQGRSAASSPAAARSRGGFGVSPSIEQLSDNGGMGFQPPAAATPPAAGGDPPVWKLRLTRSASAGGEPATPVAATLRERHRPRPPRVLVSPVHPTAGLVHSGHNGSPSGDEDLHTLLPGAAAEAAARGEPLSPAELFDEVIRRDKTFGDLLSEIKAAYESFLLDRGAPLPLNPLPPPPPAPMPKPAVAAALVALSTGGGPLSAAELAVDAVRRPWIGLGTDGGGGRGRKQVLALERENEALRCLVQRLQGEANGQEGHGGAPEPGTTEPSVEQPAPSPAPQAQPAVPPGGGA